MQAAINSTQFFETRERVDLTCWQSIISASDKDHRKSIKIGVASVLCLISLVSIYWSLWCVIVVIKTPKLRKPTWIFKASNALKDIILCMSTTAYALWNIVIVSDEHPIDNSIGQESSVNLVELVFNIVYITCLTSSFVHSLLITFDRHQVISRPFRYHTGELLPSKIACILLGSGWLFCFVTGVSVASQTLELAERRKRLLYSGTLFSFYEVPILQKWLLGGGMGILYAITAGLLTTSLAIEMNRAKLRKARLLSGIGDPEPLRSRDNSVCHLAKGKCSNGHDDSCTNSEADANDFLLNGGGGFSSKTNDFGGIRSNLGRRCGHQEVTIFTPVNYRPSLFRRIRDTWSLYSASLCFICFTITTAIGFLVILLVDVSYSSSKNVKEALMTEVHSKPTSYCVAVMVFEYALLSQGIGYITIYLIIDDVFRPFYFRPCRKLQCKEESSRRKLRKDVRSSLIKQGMKHKRGSSSIAQTIGNVLVK